MFIRREGVGYAVQLLGKALAYIFRAVMIYDRRGERNVSPVGFDEPSSFWVA